MNAYTRKAKDPGEDWILEVRKEITKRNPKITVEQIVDIFIFYGDPMQVLFEAHDKKDTPAQAVNRLVRKFGKQIIGK